MESFWRCFESFLQSFHGELRVFLRVFIESFFRGFSRMSFESFLERFHGELREFLDFSWRVSRGFRPEKFSLFSSAFSWRVERVFLKVFMESFVRGVQSRGVLRLLIESFMVESFQGAQSGGFCLRVHSRMCS